MLWDVDKNTEVRAIPHRSEYQRWISRLTPVQIQAIRNEIVARIDGDEIATAGWIPGADWSGTPFYPIYDVACGRDEDAAAKCFGIMVWETFMQHEDRWGFGRYNLNNLPISSMTYFKVHPR